MIIDPVKVIKVGRLQARVGKRKTKKTRRKIKRTRRRKTRTRTTGKIMTNRNKPLNLNLIILTLRKKRKKMMTTPNLK